MSLWPQDAGLVCVHPLGLYKRLWNYLESALKTTFYSVVPLTLSLSLTVTGFVLSYIAIFNSLEAYRWCSVQTRVQPRGSSDLGIRRSNVIFLATQACGTLDFLHLELGRYVSLADELLSDPADTDTLRPAMATTTGTERSVSFFLCCSILYCLAWVVCVCVCVRPSN